MLHVGKKYDKLRQNTSVIEKMANCLKLQEKLKITIGPMLFCVQPLCSVSKKIYTALKHVVT